MAGLPTEAPAVAAIATPFAAAVLPCAVLEVAAVLVPYTLRRISGLCQNSGAASITTWYWFSGW